MVAPQVPSGLDADPTEYLALPRFNNTLEFEIPGTQPGAVFTVTYALTETPPDAAWPTLVFFNGLGGHRLVVAMIEGIAREHHVQILTVDRPGAGGSALTTPIALEDRTRWTHAALVAILAHLQITLFAVLSHSNGLFYALYTLLHLPPAFTVTNWTLSGPFVPPSISCSVALRLATALPAPLPNSLGTLLAAVPPLQRAVSWSSGLLSLDKTDDEDAKEQLKPPHKRGYVHRHAGATCRAAIMRHAMRESRVAIGQEALFSLHGGRDGVWGLGEGRDDAEVLRGAFARMAEMYPDDTLGIRVCYGAADGMVPSKGRMWLKGVLEDLGFLREEGAWTEVPEMGHDDVLFLEEAVGEILGRVK